MRVYREDIQSLRAPKRLPDGRLRVDGFFTRSGVFSYAEPGGKLRKEYRPPSEVFSQDSLSAYEALVVTDDHPTEMVTLSNLTKYKRGQAGENVRRDGDHIAGTVYIDDSKLIDAMERVHRPKRQLSVGYHLDIDETPGTAPNGESYDAVQRNIRPNHLAVVFNGRAGSAAVRMDSTGNNQPFHIAYQQTRLDTQNTDNHHMPDQAALADTLQKNTMLTVKLAAETSRADTAEGKAAGLEAEIAVLKSVRTDSDQVATLTVDLDTQTTRADAAESALLAVPKLVADGVKARVIIESGAFAVLGRKDDQGQPRHFDDVTDRNIIGMVLEKISGDDLAGKSDDYARAIFDTLVKSRMDGVNALAKFSRDTRINQAIAQMSAKPPDKKKDKPQPSHKTPLPSNQWSNT